MNRYCQVNISVTNRARQRLMLNICPLRLRKVKTYQKRIYLDFCHHSHFKNELWALNQRKAPYEIKPSAKNPKSKSRVVNNSRKYQTVPYKSQTEVKSTASGYKTDLKEELKVGKCSCLGHNLFGITDSISNSLLPWSYAHTSDWTPSSRTKLINKW